MLPVPENKYVSPTEAVMFCDLPTTGWDRVFPHLAFGETSNI